MRTKELFKERYRATMDNEVILTKLYTHGESYQSVLEELRKRSRDATRDNNWVTEHTYEHGDLRVYIRCKRGYSKHFIAMSMGYTEV